jgi:hypothetical protein
MRACTNAPFIRSDEVLYSDVFFIDSRAPQVRIASFVSLFMPLRHLEDRRRVPSPHAFPVSAVCRNEHSGGFGFATPPPESGRRMGSALTICDCIPDMR